MSAVIRGGTSGTDADVDSNKNLQIIPGLKAHPAAGGFYTVTGGPAGIVAAALATDTSLVAMRFATGGALKAYLREFRLNFVAATVGLSGGVGGVLGLQRFTAATPSGGTARVVQELNEPLTGATAMTSVQDLASALTMTSVVFGAEVAWFRQPLGITSGQDREWIFKPDYPLVLQPGDGLCLRTRVALAATQTWVYSYTAIWDEF